jgi:hypothetical protein
MVSAAVANFFGQRLETQRTQERVTAAARLGLASTATWADIQQVVYCRVATIGRMRRDLQLELVKLGNLHVNAANVIVYSFLDRGVGDHVALYVSYDNTTAEAQVTKRVLIDDYLLGSDGPALEFDCGQ